MENQLILDCLQRIESKLDGKADRSDHQRLEERVRANEQQLTRVYAIGTVISAALAYVGVKF